MKEGAKEAEKIFYDE